MSNKRKLCGSGWGVILLGCCVGFFGIEAGVGAAWTLADVLTYASTNNPDAVIAGRRMASARAVLQQAEAVFWPQLRLESSYVRTDHPVSVFGSVLNQGRLDLGGGMDFNNPPVADNLNVRGMATLPLYVGGKHRAALQGAKAGAKAASASAEAVQNAVAFEAARAYYTVLKAGELIRAAESAVGSFRKSLELARNRLNAGTLLRAEVLDVEVRLAQAEEDLIRARNARSLAERALLNLLGMERDSLVLSEKVPEAAIPAGRDFSGRPELRAARLGVEAGEARLREVRSGYLPRVSAFASYDYDRGWEFDGDGESWTAGAALQWDLWDGRLTRGRVRQARAELDVAREELRKVRLAIDLEVEQAQLRLKEATERLSVTGKSVDQAAESVSLTRSRFEQGLVLAVQLIDAETALTAARVRRAEAEADRRIAVAALRKALGLGQLKRSGP